MELENLVRLGTVTSVDKEKRLAQVWYDALGISSDWLPVLITHDTGVVSTQYAQGGSGEGAFDRHCHEISMQPYFPAIGEKVLVLYFPLFNGDGVILGGVRPWR